MSAIGTGLLRQAVTMSLQCGIPLADAHDVAARAMDRAVRLAARQRRSSIVHALREELARRLAVPRRKLPRDWPGLKALGHYEAQRQLYGGLQSKAWGHAFDYQSRWFALENGVCPRCARPGEFGPGAGQCECGFEYEM